MIRDFAQRRTRPARLCHCWSRVSGEQSQPTRASWKVHHAALPRLVTANPSSSLGRHAELSCDVGEVSARNPML